MSVAYSMFYNGIGWIGAIVYIIAYLLVSTRKIQATDRAFQIMNLFGAIGVSTAAFYHQDMPSVVLNVVWGCIALYSMYVESMRKI